MPDLLRNKLHKQATLLNVVHSQHAVFNNQTVCSYNTHFKSKQYTTECKQRLNRVHVPCAFLGENIKTESARTLSSCWTKLCTKIIYTLLQAFVLLLQISYQKKSFLTTPNIENQSRSSAEFH